MLLQKILFYTNVQNVPTFWLYSHYLALLRQCINNHVVRRVLVLSVFYIAALCLGNFIRLKQKITVYNGPQCWRITTSDVVCWAIYTYTLAY